MKEKHIELDSEEQEIEEKVLEHLSKSITGERELQLSIKNVECSLASNDDKKILIQKFFLEATDKEQLKRFWKRADLHESGHIAYSGSMMKEFKSWKTENGEFGDYKELVNCIEDVRIEEVLTRVLPQSRKYFIEFMKRFAEKRGVIKTNNPAYALRLELDTKYKIPYELDPKAKPYMEEAIKIFNDDDAINGNWEDIKETAMKIHRVFQRMRKAHPKEFGGSSAEMEEKKKEITELMKGLDSTFKKLREESETTKSEKSKIEKDMGELEKAMGEGDDHETDDDHDSEKGEDGDDRLDEGEDEGEDVEAGKEDKDEGKGLKERDSKKSAEERMKELEEKKKELEKKSKELDEKIRKNSEKYGELEKEKTELSKEIEKAKTLPRAKTIGEFVVVSDFEKRKEDGKLAELKGEELIAEIKKISEDMEKTEESTIFKELERYADMEPPLVKEFGSETGFKYEGSYPAPNLGLALELGDEIASALKRELKLKKSLVKKKTSGMLDMKRVRKQYTYYGEIQDTDIFARTSKRESDHSVLVMIDLSGSMESRNKLPIAKQAMATLSRTLGQLGVNFSLRGYTALGGEHVIGDIIIKEFSKDEADYSVVNRVFYPNRSETRGWWGENRDGDSWRYGADLLSKQPGQKLLIVLSDGVPMHGGTNYYGMLGEKDSQMAVEQIEDMGIKVLGISIDVSANGYINRVFKNSFFFDGEKLGDLAEGLTEIYIATMQVGA